MTAGYTTYNRNMSFPGRLRPLMFKVNIYQLSTSFVEQSLTLKHKLPPLYGCMEVWPMSKYISAELATKRWPHVACFFVWDIRVSIGPDEYQMQMFYFPSRSEACICDGRVVLLADFVFKPPPPRHTRSTSRLFMSLTVQRPGDSCRRQADPRSCHSRMDVDNDLALLCAAH